MTEPTTKTCRTCEKEQDIGQYGRYTDVRNSKVRIRNECNSCRVRREVKRNQDDPDGRKPKDKAYRQRHKESMNEYQKKHKQKKMQQDMQFRLRVNIAGRTRSALRKNKVGTTEELTCCTYKQLKAWIEHQFTEDLDWDNKDDWHVDHVVPLCFFDLTKIEEQHLACHWTNLRPLKSHANQSKGGKILKADIISHMDIVKDFLTENEGYQTSIEKCWWQRLDLWYGKNPEKEEGNFKKLLQRIIRSEGSS
jgi:hypothetical protein